VGFCAAREITAAKRVGKASDEGVVGEIRKKKGLKHHRTEKRTACRGRGEKIESLNGPRLKTAFRKTVSGSKAKVQALRASFLMGVIERPNVAQRMKEALLCERTIKFQRESLCFTNLCEDVLKRREDNNLAA